ncbi:MAG TPA: hypothetical protein VF766_06830, partial [Pyrinomonadaceae bacterium]
MPPKKPDDRTGHGRPILGRIAPDEFVGRERALAQVLRLSSQSASERGLLLLAAPSIGVSEFLRQAYDELFRQHGDTIPIYFALTRNDKSAVGAARHFLQTFLQQTIAYRRRDSSLSNAALSINDLLEMVPPGDYGWVERLLEAKERVLEGGDAQALVRLCLSAPQRATQNGARTFVLMDGLEQAGQLNGVEVPLEAEIARALMHSGGPYVLAGLRRHLLAVVHGARNGNDFAS